MRRGAHELRRSKRPRCIRPNCSEPHVSTLRVLRAVAGCHERFPRLADNHQLPIWKGRFCCPQAYFIPARRHFIALTGQVYHYGWSHTVAITSPPPSQPPTAPAGLSAAPSAEDGAQHPVRPRRRQIISDPPWQDAMRCLDWHLRLCLTGRQCFLTVWRSRRERIRLTGLSRRSDSSNPF